MKLLVITQAIDEQDPILGFFVRWVEELAKKVERVEVICLREGKHALPANVRVRSLGKETGVSRVKYVFNFFRYIWRLRRDYDTVLDHMNPEYIILGGLLWRLWGKRIAFWYNHPQGGPRLALASLLAQKIFYTSPYAATAHSAKAVRMPAGIDTSVFAPHQLPRDRHALYMQGRIMPSKRIHVALEALRILRETTPATLTLVGPEDATYGRELREQFADLIASGAAVFAGPKPNAETPALYARARVVVNLAASGHFDKSVLEAMACETLVVISSKAFEGLVPAEWVVPEGDPRALAEALGRLIALPEGHYEALGRAERGAVEQSQSLRELANRLVRELEAGVAL